MRQRQGGAIITTHEEEPKEMTKREKVENNNHAVSFGFLLLLPLVALALF
jgi:hypothetical protein